MFPVERYDPTKLEERKDGKQQQQRKKRRKGTSFHDDQSKTPKAGLTTPNEKADQEKTNTPTNTLPEGEFTDGLGPIDTLIHEEDHGDNHDDGQVISGRHGGNVVEPSRDEIQRALDTSKLPLRQVAEAWKLAPFLIRNLERDQFQSFFPIQALSIPDAITSERHPHIRAQDICITAPTGSGKTLSYVLPILNALSGRLVRRLCALVVLPTRDLAMQVCRVLQRYMDHSDLRVGLAVGQSDFESEQIAITVGDTDGQLGNHGSSSLKRLSAIDPTNLDLALNNSGRIKSSFQGLGSKNPNGAIDVLVCTPGRLIDHMDNTPGFTLQHLKFLVLDEADRLLSERYQNWIDRALRDVANGDVSYTRGNTGGSKTTPVNGGDINTEYEPRTWRRSMNMGARDSIQHTGLGLSLSSGALPIVHRPVQLRKFLVSATMTRDPQKLELLRLVNAKIFNVHLLSGEPHTSVDSEKFLLPQSLDEYIVDCTAEQKPLVLCAAIMRHIKDLPSGLVVVFTASVESSHRLARLLQLMWKTGGHGDLESVVEFSSALTQDERTKLVQRCSQYKDRNLAVVVCSDGMSRGIDLDTVTLVVNYDVPNFAKTYVHRCGE